MIADQLDFRSFASFCAEESRAMTDPGEDYLRQHLGRFYETYRECLPLIPRRAAVLSVGAGDAYVEKQLARACGAQVTVADFPEAIERRRHDYRRHAFRVVGMNLADTVQPAVEELFDVVLSFEVIEHLPMAPQQHLRLLSDLLKPGGSCVVTTPNMAHLPNVCRLLRGRALLPDARLTFSAASYAHEHVHRREYVAAEIIDAMRSAGLSHEKTAYLSCRNPLTLQGWVRRLYDVAPRWKKTMLLVGRKSG